MSTTFPAKNGLTFTRYLCLTEFVSKYPSTFLIRLSPIIKTFSYYLLAFHLLHHLIVFLLSSIVKCYFVDVVVVDDDVAVVTVVVLSKIFLRCAPIFILDIFLFSESIVDIIICLAPGLALGS